MAATTSSAFEHWRAGYGPITHTDETIERIRSLAQSPKLDPDALYRLLAAADRLASAAMWIFLAFIPIHVYLAIRA
ncbi:MAG TPA: hypothetical protein PKE13_01875, partial [Hyphomicrobium zavarzinii]|nr:hypothetical protein [Hyphomicrobium zavarzinii]